jgi:protein-serine/threonine kinase
MNPKKRVIKLVDFGISGFKKEDTTAGTITYMAPEILSGENIKATLKVDIFAMGVILYMILFDKHPFYRGRGEDISECRQAMIDCKLLLPENVDPEKGKYISDDCIDLMKGMLEKDSGKRMSTFDCVTHPWLTMEPEELQESVDVKK